MAGIFQPRGGAMSQLAMSGQPRQNDALGSKLVQSRKLLGQQKLSPVMPGMRAILRGQLCRRGGA